MYCFISLSNYRPTRIYIKSIVRDCGKKIFYFGKTTRDDIISYIGSGVIWESYIKKYGRNSIITEWHSDYFLDHYELQNACVNFSIENNIVDSKDWANLKFENGLDGGYIHPKTRISISNKMKGVKKTGGSGTHNRIWYTKGLKRTCILPSQIMEYEKSGWVKGYNLIN